MKTELVLGSLFNFLWFFRLAYFLYFDWNVFLNAYN